MTRNLRDIGTKRGFPAALSVIAVGTAALLMGLSWPASADERGGAASDGEEVAYVGRIMDAHCYMTGKYPSSDRAKCTADCIRAGVPALLVMDDGLVLLGQGTTGAAKLLTAHAFQEVTVRGMLFEKDGMAYVDVRSIGAPEPEEPREDGFTSSEYDDED